MKVIVGDYWRTINMKKRFNEYSPMADKNLKQTGKKPFGELYPDRPAVRLEISGEGMESMRKRAQELGGRCEPEDFEPAIMSVNYSHLFHEELDDSYFEMGRSYEDKAADLVQAYGKLYDKIVKGHESGQREIYVETPGGEERARRITLSEELTCLNEAFKEYSDELQEEIAFIKSPETRTLDERRMEFLLRHSTGARKEELLAEREEIRRRIERIPDNIGEKMASAVQEFIAQYLSGSMKSVADILASIKMF
ncbi:MAG: hypothetical protein HFI66_10680 [Lachnospiraceae bacterium]|jgi:hypothetical protein|nr:hypothetical protein [Lachnospiraceae bacterium]